MKDKTEIQLPELHRKCPVCGADMIWRREYTEFDEDLQTRVSVQDTKPYVGCSRCYHAIVPMNVFGHDYWYEKQKVMGDWALAHTSSFSELQKYFYSTDQAMEYERKMESEKRSGRRIFIGSWKYQGNHFYICGECFFLKASMRRVLVRRKNGLTPIRQKGYFQLKDMLRYLVPGENASIEKISKRQRDIEKRIFRSIGSFEELGKRFYSKRQVFEYIRRKRGKSLSDLEKEEALSYLKRHCQHFRVCGEYFFRKKSVKNISLIILLHIHSPTRHGMPETAPDQGDVRKS